MPLGVPEELKEKCGSSLLRVLKQAKPFNEVMNLGLQVSRTGDTSAKKIGDVPLPSITLEDLRGLKGLLSHGNMTFEIREKGGENTHKPEEAIIAKIGTFVLDNGTRLGFTANTDGEGLGSCIIKIK